MKADSMRVMNFCKGLFADSALEPIRPKVNILPISFGEKGTTFEMLTDSSKPTEDAKIALATWAKKIEECSRARWASMRQFSPPVTSQEIVLEEAIFPRFQFLIADLYNHIFTYGEFARKRAELTSEYVGQVSALRQLLAQQSADARYRAEQLAQEARKAAALEEEAANLRHLRHLKEIESIRPRMPITCTTYFNMTTCQ